MSRLRVSLGRDNRSRYPDRTAKVVLLLVVGSFALSAGAGAETMNYPRDPLAPASPGGSGVSTMAWDGTFRCTLTATVQNAASKYAIGTCFNGHHLRRQDKSAVYNGHTWDGGYVFGDFNGCGWIQSEYSNFDHDSTEALCAPGEYYNNPQFQRANNNNTPVNAGCSKKPNADGVMRCTDGTPVQITAGCNEYGNARPWLSGQYRTGLIRSTPRAYTVYWRYITKYDMTNSGRPAVMIRDSNDGHDDGAGNWVFVDRNCLPPSLPGINYDLSY